MSNRKLLYVLIFTVAFAIMLQIMQHYFRLPSLVCCYLDDVLIIPITATAALWIQRRFIVRSDLFRFNVLTLIALVIYFSIVFEWLIPVYSSRYTADKWDIIAYATGAFLFHVLINTPKAKPCASSE